LFFKIYIFGDRSLSIFSNLFFFHVFSIFFGESILGFSKMDKNKCPKIEMAKYFAQKHMVCDHKLFLWSGYQKNNF
jgi:hypothetical protein